MLHLSLFGWVRFADGGGWHARFFVADFNYSTFDFDGIGSYTVADGIDTLTSSNIDLPEVEAAGDLVTVNNTIIERRRHMRTEVLDGVELASDIKDGDGTAVNYCMFGFAEADITKFTDWIELH